MKICIKPHVFDVAKTSICFDSEHLSSRGEVGALLTYILEVYAFLCVEMDVERGGEAKRLRSRAAKEREREF